MSAVASRLAARFGMNRAKLMAPTSTDRARVIKAFLIYRDDKVGVDELLWVAYEGGQVQPDYTMPNIA